MAPIRIEIPAFLAARTTCSVLSAPPMLPGLMRTAWTPASIALSASEALKWMSAITGQRRETNDQRERVRVLGLWHGDAHELAPCRGQRGDLRGRRLDVVRLRQRHRLHDDGRATPDRDTADRDLPFAGIAAQGTRGGRMRSCPRAPALRPGGASSRRPTTTPATSGPWAQTSSPGRCSRHTASASSPCRSATRSAGSHPPAARSSRSLGFAPSRSLRRAARRYEIRVDTAFGEVIRGCARPGDPASWIDAAIVEAYETLHRLGWAHSVEAHDDEGLAGGLYGVALGGLFAAESMFSRRTDASKAAFVALVERLRSRRHARAARARRAVADTAPRLARRGRGRRRRDYRRRLTAAATLPSPFV